MVRIKNKRTGIEREITLGVFNSLFSKSKEWVIVNRKEVEDNGEVDGDLDEDFEPDNAGDNKEDKEEVDDEEIDDEDDFVIDDEDLDDEDNELLEKPLSAMNLSELRRYCEIKEINIEGLDSKKEIREAISSFESEV